MVRLAAPLLGLCLASAALAQDAPPPFVMDEAPTLATPQDDSAAPLQLPDHAGQGAAAAQARTATATTTATAAPAAAPVETDLLSLVLKAHWVVQTVMALLVLAIVAVLTVFLFKLGEFTLAFARLRRAIQALAKSPGLAAQSTDCPLSEATRAAEAEVAGLPPTLTADLRASARDRLTLALDRIEARAVQRLRSGTGLLASIGAVAPFVGLFGTVIGIMNSFLAIAAAKTTSLVVVAPGIAEALLATGIGLAAAIPAVLLYNRIMRRIATFRHRLADGTAELQRRFSHELDRRMMGA